MYDGFRDPGLLTVVLLLKLLLLSSVIEQKRFAEWHACRLDMNTTVALSYRGQVAESRKLQH